MKKRTIMLATLSMLVMAQVALAAQVGDLVDRLDAINARIWAGEKTGTLTPKESAALRKRVTAVESEIESKRKGLRGIDRKDYDDISRKITDLSRDVSVEKHDADTKQAAQMRMLNIQQRIASIDRRIANGKKTGALTAGEQSSLMSRLDAIKRDFAATKKGDGVSRDEFNTLNSRLEALSKDVLAEKVDSATRASEAVKPAVPSEINIKVR